MLSGGLALLFNFLCGLEQVIETVPAVVSSFPLKMVIFITALLRCQRSRLQRPEHRRRTKRQTTTMMMIKETITGMREDEDGEYVNHSSGDGNELEDEEPFLLKF